MEREEPRLEADGCYTQVFGWHHHEDRAIG